MLKQQPPKSDRSDPHLPTRVKVWKNGTTSEKDDRIAQEAPLSITLLWSLNGKSFKKDFAVMLRSPSRDFELVTGLLFTEGIIQSASDIVQMQYMDNPVEMEEAAALLVTLGPNAKVDPDKMERYLTSYSSCGMCGKASLKNVEQFVPYMVSSHSTRWSAESLHQLPGKLREQQAQFEETGGMHAAAFFDKNGDIQLVREDIGRHNAVDKLIGAALATTRPPFSAFGLLLSGRAGFELIQKALMAGIPMVAAIGSASSMAIRLAEENDQTLIGFLKKDRMVQYSGWDRVTA